MWFVVTNRTGLSQYPVFKVQVRQETYLVSSGFPTVVRSPVVRRRGITLRIRLEPVNNFFQPISRHLAGSPFTRSSHTKSLPDPGGFTTDC